MAVISIILSVILLGAFSYFQRKYFLETKKYIELYINFFRRTEVYKTYTNTDINVPQIEEAGEENSDLRNLIREINHYVVKTKGTTDFSVIQNKVERKLNMRYEQSIAKLSFPTYLGLMGTFSGVFIGIFMFNLGFDSAEGITDDSIRNLLYGVLVSMATSLVGLILTTINNAYSSESKRVIEEGKNDFYAFVQTELMPQVDVSMSAALTRLHVTVDKFEPAFNGVITNFQRTFDKCTSAFGDTFEKNVLAVANAVAAMGINMNKINENIDKQEKLLSTLRSDDFIKGLDRYVEAANHFAGITKSLNKFEDARRMMLAAAQEAINIQNQYSESLRIPREVAVNINKILDRVRNFEQKLNDLGPALASREVLGMNIAEALKEQVDTIKKRHKIVVRHGQIADDKLNDYFESQTKVINQLNEKYRGVIAKNVEEFDEMIKNQTQEFEKVYDGLKRAIQERLSVEEIQKEFANLRKLNDILQEMKSLSENSVKQKSLQAELKKIQDEVGKINTKKDTKKDSLPNEEPNNDSIFGKLFGKGNKEKKE